MDGDRLGSKALIEGSSRKEAPLGITFSVLLHDGSDLVPMMGQVLRARHTEDPSIVIRLAEGIIGLDIHAWRNRNTSKCAYQI